MSIIEEFVDELERSEALSDMHFSIYYVPPEYQPCDSEWDRA